MATFTVHEPLVPLQAVAKRAEDVAFVKEGFSWPALILGLPWLLIRGLWLEFLAGVALTTLASSLFVQAGMPMQAVSWALIFFNILLGFEFHNLERWKLQRKGFKLIGIATGDNFEDAERRFFTRWLPRAEAEWQTTFEGRTTAASAIGREREASTTRARIDEPVIGFLGADR